jgi:hypothetical protein
MDSDVDGNRRATRTPKGSDQFHYYDTISLFLITVFENSKKKIFRSFWLEMKLLFQELAILVFLVVLCVFSLQQKQDITSSRLSWGLEFVVIITVTKAISCEALLMVYRMYEIPKAALLKVK